MDMAMLRRADGLLASVMAVVLLGACASGARAAGLTAYVAGYDPGNFTSSVVPIDLATNVPGAAIPVGANPLAIAIAPDGSTAYALGNNDTVTPIDLATNTPETPIPAGSLGNNESSAIAIAPDGSTAYVTDEAVNYGGNSVTPIDLETNTPETPIPFDRYPTAIVIAPDGRTAYVTGSPNSGNGTVTPIDLATNTPGTPITLGADPQAIAITPDGSTAYVADSEDETVTPIDLATNTPETAISVTSPVAIAISPDGSTAYVVSYDGTVVPIDLATNTPETPITVAADPDAIAITPDGLSAYVTSSGEPTRNRFIFGSGSVTPIDLATDTPGTPITVSSQLPAIAITPPVIVAPTVTVTSPAGDGTATTTPAQTPTPTPTPTTTATTTTAPVTQPSAPAVRTRISQISMTTNLVLWCRGRGCRYPRTALRFMLNHTATIRLALRTSAHWHWNQVATTNLQGHQGFNRHRIAGRWHGHLVAAGPVQILVQIRRDDHWTTAKTIGLTVRHAR
jgi:YVTN family beta-propeller protein